MQQYRLTCCRRYELRQNPRFAEIVAQFRARFQLDDVRRKALDNVSLDRRNGMGAACVNAPRIKFVTSALLSHAPELIPFLNFSHVIIPP